MRRTRKHRILKFLPLAGALSLPLASMANDASGFPTVENVITGTDLLQDGPDAMIYLAQGFGGDTGSGGSPSSDRPDGSDHGVKIYSPYGDMVSTLPGDAGISPSATAAIVGELQAAIDYCQAMRNPAYNVDCLSYQFWLTAQSMPKTGGYADARKALLDAADKLHALALANRDRSKPAAKANVGGKRTSRPLTPVTNSAAVNAQAAAIVQDTNLVLLRSTSGSQQRRVAYTQIAAVVNSTKVLLRSS